MSFQPRTRTERVLVRACELIAEQANPELVQLMVSVAIAQAEDEIPPALRIDGRIFTYVQRVVECGIPNRSDL